MTTKTEMTLENVKAGDRVICRKELSHPTFIIWKEYDIVIQGESLYIVSHTYDLFSINESTLEIINEHFTLVTREDVITLSNAAFMYIKGEQDSESIRKIYDEKVIDEINKIWWLNHHYYSLIHGILSPSMHEPNKHILSTSDYLLLLSAPESQAHLLTERSEPCGNCKETIKECACMRNICFKCNKPVGNITFSVCDECWNILHPPKNNSAKELLASQPPVMEGKEEKITYQTTLTDKELINLCDEWVSKMCKTGGKAFTMSVPVRLNYDTDVVLSALINRFSLANKTIQSLQSEVEQLKGLLKEAQPFCGTMLRGKIEHYTSK